MAASFDRLAKSMYPLIVLKASRRSRPHEVAEVGGVADAISAI
jgi:hypothetical protein